jgi:hypothetical protein
VKTKEKIKKEVKKASDELAGIEKEGIFHK